LFPLFLAFFIPINTMAALKERREYGIPLVELASRTSNYHILGFGPSSKERDDMEAQIETLGRILASPESFVCGGLLERRRLHDEALIGERHRVEAARPSIEVVRFKTK